MNPTGLANNPLSLADDFYLLAHHNVTGTPLLHEDALGFGLAASLLGELILSGWVSVDVIDEQTILTAIDRRQVLAGEVVTQSGRPSLVTLDRGVWNIVVREPCRLPLRKWLSALGQTAPAQVADRLVEAGHLRPSRSRKGTPEPTNWSLAGGPGSRLWAYLHYRRREASGQGLPPVQDVALLSLADAAGLGGVVTSGHEDEDGHARAYYAQLLAALASHYPQLSELAAQTRAAVASAVLTR